MRYQNKSNRRVIFVNRYFYPDHSATSQILSDLAFYLAKNGFEIEIVTSRQKYDDPQADLKASEIINHVSICRVWTTYFGRSNLLGRAVDYFSFYVSAAIYLLIGLHRDDIIVAKTDPPLISIVAAIIAKLKGAILINWTQDLFPEVAKSLGVKALSFLYPILTLLRNYSLKAAYKNVVIGEQMSNRLKACGLIEDKIVVIHNWSIEDDIEPIPRTENPFREKWKLTDKFVIGYSGNIGRSHDIDTLLNVAASLMSEPNIAFVIIGGGALYDRFRKQTLDLGLTNVAFKPYQPKEVLPYSLTLPDLHVISLLPELEGLIVPSKFYGIVASGRPVLYIGNTAGEIPEIIRANCCGKSVNISDVGSAVNFIRQLNTDPDLLVLMGENSRKIADGKYNKSLSLNSWVHLLSSI